MSIMYTKDDENRIPERMLTVKEVASILNVHPNIIRRWENGGLLKSYSIGPRRSIRLKQEDIIDLLDSSRNEVHHEGHVK